MVLQVLLDLEFRVIQEEQVLRVLQGLLAHKDLLAHKVHRALLVITEELVLLVLKVLLGHKANQL
jgi:hypothetical protein